MYQRPNLCFSSWPKALVVAVLCGRLFLFVHLWPGAEVVDVLNKSVWAILKYAKVSLHFSQSPFSRTAIGQCHPVSSSPVPSPRTSMAPC